MGFPRRNQSLWKRVASSIKVIVVDFVPVSIEEKSAELMTYLRQLHEEERKRNLKLMSFREKIEQEKNEEFKAQISTHLEKLIADHNVTTSDVLVYQGRIRKLVANLCKEHKVPLWMSTPRKGKLPQKFLMSINEGIPRKAS